MIKLGNPDTVNHLIYLGLEWAKDAAMKDFDEDEWRATVRGYSIYVDHRSLCFYDALNKPAGFLLGAVTKIPHSGVMVGQIHYVYLKPEHCTYENFYQLHEEFRNWAESFGVKQLTAPDFYQLPDEYDEFFIDLGFEESTYQKIKGLA